MTTDPLWYQSAIFYEVNVRAFYDSNADGHGDLPGLIEKLDYLRDLGVNCIWVMPIYDLPLRDDGYDISDFLKIQAVFGNVQDFRRLIEEAHARGMRIITDMIMNHTSDQHPWFQAARCEPNSPYRDFYVWSDTREKYIGCTHHLSRYGRIRIGAGMKKPSNIIGIGFMPRSRI